MSVGEKMESVWKNLAEAARSRWPKEAGGETEADPFLERALRAAKGGDGPAASRALAAALADEIKGASGERLSLRLAALSVGMAPERGLIKGMLESIDLSNADAVEMEEALKGALKSPRRELLRLWLSLDGGLSFLVWLRAKTLEEGLKGHEAKSLESELTECLSEVFAQGLLKMKAVDWNSPAALLEKIMEHDSGHKFGSWGDLKSRLNKDRRVYALFHSGWAAEPVCFLEVALTRGMVKRASDLNQEGEPLEARLADTAVFYSINSPHAGLKGISFGEDLIRKAVEDLRLTAPGVKSFCALSPIPSFSRWLQGLSEERLKEALSERWGAGREAEAWGREELLERAQKVASERLPERMKEALVRLCARYLAGGAPGERPQDPVARFHLGNGARLESICFGADFSERALRQSFGMMAVYSYETEDLDKSRLDRSGPRAASWRVRRQAR